eukprot:CAMPEP_0115058434 /NCGR_PEP_ID=MMETSP0227-20121206/6344_1 /TAXON_ID=89957 /ORGANISM="Polarella glacialis, Strain CCMP 1383" /LENGTH=115 /DNA_ID=CAMNT_0002443413 /DNA_START=230 /DNA_END=577 /DNA_ORIENTATION=+
MTSRGGVALGGCVRRWRGKVDERALHHNVIRKIPVQPSCGAPVLIQSRAGWGTHFGASRRRVAEASRRRVAAAHGFFEGSAARSTWDAQRRWSSQAFVVALWPALPWHALQGLVD